MDLRLVAVVVLSGCAVAATQPSLGRHDGGSAIEPDDDVDLAVRRVDFAMLDSATLDLWQPDLGTWSSQACTPRINEVMTGAVGQPTAEFVEVYNPCTTAVDLSGWKIVYRAGNNVSTAGGVDSSLLWVWPAGAGISPKQFLVYGGAPLGSARNGALAASLLDGAGAVGLRNAAGTLIDSLGYGSVDPASAFLHGLAALAPPVLVGGAAIGRVPDGKDTGDNYYDFRVCTTTPGFANY